MPFAAPDTDVLDAPDSGGFSAPDHEVISGFSAPANDLSFGANPTPEAAPGAGNPSIQGFSLGNLTADDWERFLSGVTPADSDSDPAVLAEAKNAVAAAFQADADEAHQPTPSLDPDKLAYDRLALENSELGDPAMQPGNSYLTAIANHPKTFLAVTVTAPFKIAGRTLGAAADDAGATIGTTAAGHPELAGQQGGNLYHLFAADDDTPTPQEQVLRDIAAQHPLIATTGKVAQGVVESLPMMAAGLPEGVLGKLLGTAFAAQMINSAGDAATDLGNGMGKPAEQRDPDKITSALADLIQAGALAPGMGAHTLGAPIGERFFPHQEAVDRLIQQLQGNPFQGPYGRNLVNLGALQNSRVMDQPAQVMPIPDSGVIPVDLPGSHDLLAGNQLKLNEPVPVVPGLNDKAPSKPPVIAPAQAETIKPSVVPPSPSEDLSRPVTIGDLKGMVADLKASLSNPFKQPVEPSEPQQPLTYNLENETKEPDEGSATSIESNPSPAMGAGSDEGNPARAAAHLRGSSDTVPVSRGAAAEIRNQSLRLQQWAQQSGKVADYEPPPGSTQSSGAEHEVFFDPQSNRVVKRTYPGTFGSVMTENGLRRTATPYFYLRRLDLMNQVFGSDIRVEGVVPGERSSIITSQPLVKAADPASPLPSSEQISDYMQRLGFIPTGVRPFDWIRQADGVRVSDTRPDNFVLSKTGPVPIDLIAERVIGKAPSPTAPALMAKGTTQIERSAASETVANRPDTSFSVGESPDQSIPKEQVQNVVAGLHQELPNAVPTVVHANPSEMAPDDLEKAQASARAQGVDLNHVKGIALDGKVHLFANNLASPAEA